MKTCSNCGHVISGSSLQSCPQCGYALIPESPVTDTPPVQPSLTPAPLPSPETLFSPPQSTPNTIPSWPISAAQPQSKKRSPVVLWLLVAFAVLLVLTGGGITYVAGHGRMFGGAPLIAQATATPTATLLPTATATATATVTPHPTATPKPTATATPVPRLVTIFRDQLTANSHNAGWYTDGGSVYFQSDGYRIGNGYECYVPIASQTDFNVSVQVKEIGGTNTQGFGITFRAVANTPKEYVFAITSNGSFYAFNRVGNYLIMPTHSSAIHQGLNVTNTIEVHARGSHFDFVVNGVQVGSADDSMRLSGQIGLMTEQTGEAAVFSNIAVTKWV